MVSSWNGGSIQVGGGVKLKGSALDPELVPPTCVARRELNHPAPSAAVIPLTQYRLGLPDELRPMGPVCTRTYWASLSPGRVPRVLGCGDPRRQLQLSTNYKRKKSHMTQP